MGYCKKTINIIKKQCLIEEKCIDYNVKGCNLISVLHSYFPSEVYCSCSEKLICPPVCLLL